MKAGDVTFVKDGQSLASAAAEYLMKQDAASEPFNRLQDRLSGIGGCGDGDCKVIRPVGQHTNGGCRCLRHNHFKAESVISAYRAYATAVEAELKRLRAEVAS